MRAAFVVTLYKRPDLAAHVLASLGQRDVAVHIDRKSPERSALRALCAPLANVKIIRSRVCHWGLYGVVGAVRDGLRWFLTTSNDYCFVITGQCYPLRPLLEIEEELSKINGRSMIEMEAFPRREWMRWEAGGWRRIDRFYFFLRRLRHVKLFTRRLPIRLQPFGGSGYFALCRNHVEYIVNFLDRNPQVERFFRTTYIPDEVMFQTILGSSPYAHEIVNRSTHFTEWDRDAWHPNILQLHDVKRAMESGAWFARKFDDVDALRAIAAVLGSNTTQ